MRQHSVIQHIVVGRADSSSQNLPTDPWVLVAGGFHYLGGMDRANAALAEYLCASGHDVHLVSFRIDPELAAHRRVTAHLVRRPMGSHLLNARRLDRRGREVARAMTARDPGTRVLVNGTNCAWPDLNWIHFVHARAGHSSDAPLWYKAKTVAGHWKDCRDEKRIPPTARMLIANSERTRQDLVERVGIDTARIHTIYLGTNDDWKTITPERRAKVRAQYGIAPEQPLIIFVGAMGYDERKGFDTLWAAWEELCADPSWDGELIAAGGGRALPKWRKAVANAGLERRTRLIGFVENVPDLLAAADLLVSPVRYESYGLNVQEALACGVPAIVSASAGVAERYPAELGDLLLVNPEEAGELAARIRNWRGKVEEFKRLTEPVAQRLRKYKWEDMAAAIVGLAEEMRIPK
jgi:glycosyltransferase involved in cell wall biosynthesis